jgi:hypothetical protein
VEGAVDVPSTARVSALLPVHLPPGVTSAQATTAITAALSSHLASRTAALPLTFDSLAAAIRDDSRFALIRSQATVTVETAGRFMQLSDGVGSYAPAAGETLTSGELNVDSREGGA